MFQFECGGEFYVRGGLMVTEGLRVTSLTCTGTGWRFWLVDFEQIPFRVAGDTFIEPVKLTKAVSWSRTRVTITHTQTHTHTHPWQERERACCYDHLKLCISQTQISASPWGFPKLLQSCLTSVMLEQRMHSEFYWADYSVYAILSCTMQESINHSGNYAILYWLSV